MRISRILSYGLAIFGLEVLGRKSQERVLTREYPPVAQPPSITKKEDKSAYKGKDLRGADFRGQKLDEYDFSGAELFCPFNGASLRFTVFHGADCSGTFFQGADLTGADFTGAKLDNGGGKNWLRERFKGAKLINA